MMTSREQFEAWFNAEFNADYLTGAEKAIAKSAWQARGEIDAKRIAELEADLAIEALTEIRDSSFDICMAEESADIALSKIKGE